MRGFVKNVHQVHETGIPILFSIVRNYKHTSSQPANDRNVQFSLSFMHAINENDQSSCQAWKLPTCKVISNFHWAVIRFYPKHSIVYPHKKILFSLMSCVLKSFFFCRDEVAIFDCYPRRSKFQILKYANFWIYFYFIYNSNRMYGISTCRWKWNVQQTLNHKRKHRQLTINSCN